MLLVAALSMELMCLVQTNDLSGRVIGSLSDRSEKAASDAASAIDRSKQAVELSEKAEQTSNSLTDRVASVDKEADAVSRRIESASKQLSKLGQTVRVQGPRWRSLEDGKATFIDVLKPFAGQRVTVVSCGMAAEPSKLEQDLLNFLGKQGAGWESPGYTTWNLCASGATFYSGNLVIFASTASEGVKNSARALGKVLNELAVSTATRQATPEMRRPALESLGADSPWELAARDPTAVILLVGTNPMFDLAGTNNRHKE